MAWKGPERASSPTHCQGAISGWFPAEPLPWEGDDVSWFAWISAWNLSRVQPGALEKVSRHRTLCSGLSESPVPTLEMKSSVPQYPRHPGCPSVQGHGLAQVSLEDSVSVLEWFLLENVFSSHFGAVKRLKNPAFFPKCCRVLQDLSLFFQFLFPPLSIFV